MVLAHPVRNHFKVDDELLSVLNGLEVWNQQYEGKRVPRTRSLKYFTELKEKRPLLVATGGVDLHRKEHLGAPTISLSIEHLVAEEILEKLKAGAFTIHSSHALLYGSLPNVSEIIQKYRLQSFLSVSIITLGKMVNAFFATFHISLPKSLKQFIRRYI